jgi:hypothetical protein
MKTVAFILNFLLVTAFSYGPPKKHAIANRNVVGASVIPHSTYNIFTNFIASGYMGDSGNIISKENWKDVQRPGCMKFTYTPGSASWAGLAWQYPANNWCKQPGRNLSKSKFTRLTFFAKGDKGGEQIKCKMGQDCGDSFVSDQLVVNLTGAWKQYVINVKGWNLSNITGAFSWVADANANSGTVITFYLDKVQLEN